MPGRAWVMYQVGDVSSRARWSGHHCDGAVVQASGPGVAGAGASVGAGAGAT